MLKKLTLTLSVMAATLFSQMALADTLSLAQAKEVAQGAALQAQKMNLKVAIVISDANGDLIYLEKQDGVQLGSVDVAMQKAKTSARFKRSTKNFSDRIKSGDTQLLSLNDISFYQGGEAIFLDGQLVGAIGISGAKETEDRTIALAGLKALAQ